MVDEPKPQKKVISSASPEEVRVTHDMLEKLRALGRPDCTNGLVFTDDRGGRIELTKVEGASHLAIVIKQ